MRTQEPYCCSINTPLPVAGGKWQSARFRGRYMGEKPHVPAKQHATV